MSKVKRICVSVAAAGVLAGVGAGASLLTPISASADTETGQAADAPAESAKSGARSSSRESRGPARSTSAATPADPHPAAADSAPRRSTDPATGQRDNDRSARTADPRPTVDADSSTTRTPSTRQSTERRPAPAITETGPAITETGTVSTAAPASTSASVEPTPAEAAPAPAVPATPAPEPLTLPPLPVPAAPVSPGTAVSGAGSVASTRRRVSAGDAVAQVAADPAHVLLIGVDGINLDAILNDPTNDNFFELMAQGVTGATTMVGHTTLSGPSWTSILAGVWDSKSGVINNIFSPVPYESWPTVFNLLEYHDPNIQTTVVADWGFITDIAAAGGYPADTINFVSQVEGDEDWSKTDAEVTADTVALISATNPTTSSFLFSYLVQVDEASHMHGGSSPEYAQAVSRVNTDLGQILDAVSQWESATGEDWTVLLTTDHGQQPQLGFGHGFQTPAETAAFVIADIAGDDANDGKQNLAYSTVDITPTILELFGVPQRSDFDGVPIQSDPTVLESLVAPDDLKQALLAAKAAFGYPDIPENVALTIRTVFGAIPYFLNIGVNAVVDQLQAIVDEQIILVSTLAEVAKVAIQITGDLLVGATQALAKAVGYLTGAGTIPPTDPPLPPPTTTHQTPRTVLASAVGAQSAVISPNLLVNPGAEAGDPSLSGFSAVTVPGWTLTGTPTVIRYGTPRNLWPIGLSFAMPNLPAFMGFPTAASGSPNGGTQFFGGGDVATATLTQVVDISSAAGAIDLGAVPYTLSGSLGGYLGDPSSASVQVNFLDSNRTYLGADQIGPVGVLDRFFQTGFRQRETTGVLPQGTRYAQVVLTLTDRSPVLIGLAADYNNAYADDLSFTIGADLPAPGAPAPPPSTVGELDHVYMVYMENKGYTDIAGSPLAPFINSLINAYGSATEYHGLTHPSLPNYYPIMGGQDFGLTYNCDRPCIEADTTLVSNIEDAGKSWRGYAQSMPIGAPLESSGDYSTEQLPFPAFNSIGGGDPEYAATHMFPLEQMAIDLRSSATAPNFAWFAANENFNGEGPVDFPWGALQFALSQLETGNPYNVPALDQFLSETVPVILNSNAWNDPARKSALFITFDEDNNNTSLGFGDQANRVVMVVIPSPGAVAAGMRSGPFLATNHYNHYSLLRTIEEALRLPPLTNNDRYAVPMNEFWGDVLV